MSGEGNLWPYIWRSDWTVAQWQALASPGSPCYSAGLSGVQIQSGWFVDSKTLRYVNEHRADFAGLGAAGLETYQAWTVPSVVALLEPFDWVAYSQLSPAERDAQWFVPPQCDYAGAQCGIAIHNNKEVEHTVPLQQVVSLGWKVALRLYGTYSAYIAAVNARLQQGNATLFEYFTPDVLVASSATATRLLLPPATAACYPSDGSYQNHTDGMGPAGDCDFKAQLLYKTAFKAGVPDMDDAYTLFDQLTIPQEHINTVLDHMHLAVSSSLSPPLSKDAALSNPTCYWLRANPSMWSTWIQPMHKRQYVVKVKPAVLVPVYVLLGLFAALSLGLHAFLFQMRAHPVVRQSSYVLLQLMVAGSLGMYVSVLVGIQPASVGVCVGAQMIFSAAFTFFYVSMLVKSYRIDLIFNTRSLVAQKLPDSTMLRYLAVYGALDLLLVLVWVTVDTPGARLADADGVERAFVSECSSQHATVFRVLLYLLRGLALLMGAFYAVRIRHVQENFNESKFLALTGIAFDRTARAVERAEAARVTRSDALRASPCVCLRMCPCVVYQILLVSLLVLGIGLLDNDPTRAVVVWLVGVAIAVTATVLLLLGPKIVAIASATPTALALMTQNNTTVGGDRGGGGANRTNLSAMAFGGHGAADAEGIEQDPNMVKKRTDALSPSFGQPTGSRGGSRGSSQNKVPQLASPSGAGAGGRYVVVRAAFSVREPGAAPSVPVPAEAPSHVPSPAAGSSHMTAAVAASGGSSNVTGDGSESTDAITVHHSEIPGVVAHD